MPGQRLEPIGLVLTSPNFSAIGCGWGNMDDSRRATRGLVINNEQHSGVILQPGGLSGRPLIFGEVLYDEFMDGSVVLGGAPFNVAWHLRGFGIDPLLISGIGRDALGDELLARMEAHQLDTSGLQISHEHPTGRVRVSVIDEEPLFSILPEQAYDFVGAEQLPDPSGDAFSLLYHGSLAARHEVSATALSSLRNAGLPTFVDINLRPPWWELEAVQALLLGSRWLKLNQEELAELVEVDRDSTDGLLRGAQELANRIGVQTVIVTRGAAGAVAVTADGSAVCPPVPVADMVDSVGAGDAFSAVTLLGILNGWSLGTTLQRATLFAAEICGIRGAVPDDDGFYQTHLEAWKR